MNKQINELKKELSEEEKIKLLKEGISAVELLKKLTDEAYIRKQNENNNR